MILRKWTVVITTALFAIALLFISLSGAQASNKDEYRVYDTAAGKPLSLTQLTETSKDYDVVVFGEYHDNPVLHRLEADLLAAVYEQYPNVAVSLEMFERENQQILNDYLAGRVSEAAFLEQSRPWPNYRSDYARRGTLDGIDDTMLSYLPRIHRAPDGEYRQLFLVQMQAMSSKHSAMPVTAGQMEAFYRAQCLKDDTMAESIVDHHRRYPDRKIIHYQGDFHSRYRLGVVEKLQALEPELRILVLTPVYVEEFKQLPDKARSLQADGDIVIFAKKNSASS